MRSALVVLGLGICTWAAGVRAVRAFDERVLAGTEQLHDALGLIASTGKRTVALNGAQLGFESGRSELDLASWTERAAAECKRDAPDVPAELANGLVARATGDDAALVGCWRARELPHDGAGWVAVLRELARDLDLTRLGEFEVMRAQRTEDALHVVRVRSAGKLPLLSMFPATGDAPGFDLPGVPRVPGARRRLSSVQERGEPVLVSYSRKGALAELVAEHGEALRSAGFSPLEAPVSGRLSAWTRGAEMLVMTGQEQAGESFVSLLALDTRS